MKPLDYILIVVIAAVIVVATFFTIKNARSGKGCGGCGRNCSSCPYKMHIKKGEKKETDKENDKNNK